jgi:hypothetical protein
MPGQQRARGRDPVQPKVPGQQPGQGSEHGTISPVRLRADDLAPQDRDLVPQDQDLEVLRGITPCQQYQPTEHPDYEQVDETDKHER